jgi:hypothetical protein
MPNISDFVPVVLFVLNPIVKTMMPISRKTGDNRRVYFEMFHVVIINARIRRHGFYLRLLGWVINLGSWGDIHSN